MFVGRFLATLAAVYVMVAIGPTALGADPATEAPDLPTMERMQAEIARLRDEVTQLKAASSDDWLTERRAAEIRTVVEDVLADADTRASLLQDGMAAGWDDGFFLASPDGNFRLTLNGQLQFRFAFNSQSNSPSGDDTVWGFEIPRAKLWFTGNVFSPNWIYKIEGNFFGDEAVATVPLVTFARADGDLVLEDAYIGYVFDDSGFILLAGQFKVPMLEEELVYSAYQEAVERSLVNQEFSAGRTQGVAIDYRGDNFHIVAGWTDGHPATGGYNQPALFTDTEMSITVRAEGLLAGAWDQFNQLPSTRGQPFACKLGGAIHWQQNEFGPAAPSPKPEIFQWTIDASVKGDGWNIFSYFVGRHLDDVSGLGLPNSLDQYGFVLQGGYFVTDEWEVFGRYEWGSDDIPGNSDLSLLTFGANRYFHGHKLKWQTDVGVGFEPVAGTWGSGLLGTGGSLADWRTDAAGEDGQVVLRSQLQMLF